MLDDRPLYFFSRNSFKLVFRMINIYESVRVQTETNYQELILYEYFLIFLISLAHTYSHSKHTYFIKKKNNTKKTFKIHTLHLRTCQAVCIYIIYTYHSCFHIYLYIYFRYAYIYVYIFILIKDILYVYLIWL